ncbi:tyrosine-type recombinase/integrase [Nannocystis bainbridge]|uniref:Tyrosine-type recombinase/integrase n=1 Tax=Nannocystis bainbridge TaxID=2995303 RepID=A0ABT5E2F2_9BACT|nr:tyrosine-type recombinase/integrase [Nannocystis bainbridge]MDC0719955.1 tyrosine-type recombinase/integrase [Nannocystis bainbridge]
MTVGEATARWLADMESRAAPRADGTPAEVKRTTVTWCRSVLVPKLRCCEDPAGSIADLPIEQLNPKTELAWYAHLSEHRGAKVAYAALTQLRSVCAFARRLGLPVETVPTVARPDGETPPQPQAPRPGAQPRPRKPKNPRALAPLTIASPLRLAAAHWVDSLERRAQRKDASEKTAESYGYLETKLDVPVGDPEGRLFGDIPLGELNDENVEAWFHYLSPKRNTLEAEKAHELSKGTAYLLLHRLRTLLAFVATKKRIKLGFDPTENVEARNVRERPKPVDETDMAPLRDAINFLLIQRIREGVQRKRTGPSLAYYVAPAVVARLLLFSGARIGETSRTEVADLRPEGRVHLPETKTHVARIIYLDEEAREVAAFQGRLVGEGPLFDGRTLEALETAVNRFLERACALAGIERRTAHDMRHTFTHRALACNVDLMGIMMALGHTNPRTTLRVYGEGAESEGARRAAEQVAALGMRKRGAS